MINLIGFTFAYESPGRKFTFQLSIGGVCREGWPSAPLSSVSYREDAASAQHGQD